MCGGESCCYFFLTKHSHSALSGLWGSGNRARMHSYSSSSNLLRTRATPSTNWFVLTNSIGRWLCLEILVHIRYLAVSIAVTSCTRRVRTRGLHVYVLVPYRYCKTRPWSHGRVLLETYTPQCTTTRVPTRACDWSWWYQYRDCNMP